MRTTHITNNQEKARSEQKAIELSRTNTLQVSGESNNCYSALHQGFKKRKSNLNTKAEANSYPRATCCPSVAGHQCWDR